MQLLITPPPKTISNWRFPKLKPLKTLPKKSLSSTTSASCSKIEACTPMPSKCIFEHCESAKNKTTSSGKQTQNSTSALCISTKMKMTKPSNGLINRSNLASSLTTKKERLGIIATSPSFSADKRNLLNLANTTSKALNTSIKRKINGNSPESISTSLSPTNLNTITPRLPSIS